MRFAAATTVSERAAGEKASVILAARVVGAGNAVGTWVYSGNGIDALNRVAQKYSEWGAAAQPGSPALKARASHSAIRRRSERPPVPPRARLAGQVHRSGGRRTPARAGPSPARRAASDRRHRHRVRAQSRPGSSGSGSVFTPPPAGDVHDAEALRDEVGTPVARRRPAGAPCLGEHPDGGCEAVRVLQIGLAGVSGTEAGQLVSDRVRSCRGA